MQGDDLARVYTVSSPLLSKTSRYRALLNLNAVEEVLEKERPDIIESGDPYQVAWKAQASGRALRIPVVGFYHSHFPEAYIRSVIKYFGNTAAEIAMEIARVYVRKLYSRFARTLVPSEALAEVLKEWGVSNTAVMELGVDTRIFRPEEPSPRVRESLGIPPGRILLLYVGRLAAEKNTRVLFDSFEILHAGEPGRFHLLIIGDGLQRGYVEALRDRTQAVSWLQYCSDSCELAEFYRAADLFVHPGVQETFGLVTLESQACGTPVIGIRGSYMDRIIFSGSEHWASENSPKALAAAIRSRARAGLEEAGRVAAEQVAARYSWDRVFGRLLSVYQEVIEQNTPQ
jgi:alpha-1,6-mannosyltransferase